MEVVAIIAFILGLLYHKSWISFIASLALVTDGLYSFNHISKFLYPHEVSDTGLFLFALYLLFCSKRKKSRIIIESNIYIIVLLSFICFTFIVDLLFNEIDFFSIFKTSRHWVGLIISMYCGIINEDWNKCIHTIGLLVVTISLAMIIDYMFNLKMFRSGRITYGLEYTFRRGAIPSFLIFYYIPFYQTLILKQKQKKYYLYIGLMIIPIFLSGIRSMILALLILESIFFVYAVHSRIFKININTLLIIAVFCFAVLLLYNLPQVKDRFNDLRLELAGNKDYMRNQTYSGNLSFRMELLNERFKPLRRFVKKVHSPSFVRLFGRS